MRQEMICIMHRWMWNTGSKTRPRTRPEPTMHISTNVESERSMWEETHTDIRRTWDNVVFQSHAQGSWSPDQDNALTEHFPLLLYFLSECMHFFPLSDFESLVEQLLINCEIKCKRWLAALLMLYVCAGRKCGRKLAEMCDLQWIWECRYIKKTKNKKTYAIWMIFMLNY